MRRLPTLHGIAVAFVLTIVLAGCRRDGDLRPPKIVYGQRECDVCRMIISEERFAAALVVPGDDGVTKLAFDDVGCLADYLRDHPPAASATPYVHDAESNAWLDARRASFVRSERLLTPMASHLIAAASRDAATRLLERYPGSILSFDDVTRAAPTTADTASSSEGTGP